MYDIRVTACYQNFNWLPFNVATLALYGGLSVITLIMDWLDLSNVFVVSSPCHHKVGTPRIYESNDFGKGVRYRATRDLERASQRVERPLALLMFFNVECGSPPTAPVR